MKSKELEEANEIIESPKKAEEFLNALSTKQPMVDKVVKRFEEFPILIEMVKSYFEKEYTYIPVSTLACIIATIIYVINPLDLIPDPVPGAGQLDDMTLVMACLVLVDKDIQKYQEWKKQNNK